MGHESTTRDSAIRAKSDPKTVAMGYQDWRPLIEAELSDQGRRLIATIPAKTQGIQFLQSRFLCTADFRLFRQILPLSSLPDLNKVKDAEGKRALQVKAGEVQHYLHVDLNNDLEDTVSVGGVVVGEVW